MSRKTWRLEVLQDDLEEATETLTVVLSEATGAAIGRISKAQVSIMETDSKMKAETFKLDGMFLQ